jgi:hypothetical protein
MKNDNLKLWESVEKTDPKHTKKANVKGNNLTSIKPQYQIYNATKQWGSYGSSWGFKDITLNFDLKEVGLIVFKAVFYYPSGEFETINTISYWRDNAQTKLDDEFAKKVETDSLTKCLSKLGFNADVFMGRFDDLRYVEDAKKEFAPVKTKPAFTLDNFEKALAAKASLSLIKKSYNISKELELEYDKQFDLKVK